jgi:hypothetical protein
MVSQYSTIPVFPAAVEGKGARALRSPGFYPTLCVGWRGISGSLAEGGAMSRRVPLLLGITVVLATVVTTSVRAELATPEETDRVCRNWVAYVVHEKGAWAGDDAPAIRDVRELCDGSRVLARCYSIVPTGHVVVPIIKELPPAKSYSEDYGIDVNQTVGYPQFIRDVLADRLQRYLDRYGSLDAPQPAGGEVLLGRQHRKEWEWLLTPPNEFDEELQGGAYEGMRDAGPLLTSVWHQSAPYYNFCPLGNGGARCVVGCVATAAAQIMNYHDWPLKGTGTHSYWWSGDGSAPGQTLSATFRDYYDWANILDDYSGGYTQAQADAVAELCYEIGVAFEMDYGVSGSGAYTADAVTVFPTYFRYSSDIDLEYRTSHSTSSWFSIIQAEINDNLPMQYRIPGHSIVCDGWRVTARADQYHMNYGWGGSYNGWYTIDDLYGGGPSDEFLIRDILPLIPVELVGFSGEGGAGHAVLTWTTASETENLGFLVFRRPLGCAEYVQVSDELVPGFGTSSLPHTYEYVDEPLEEGVYQYRLLDVSFNGSGTEHGPVDVCVAPLQSPVRVVAVGGGPGCTFRLWLPNAQSLRLSVHSVTGRQVSVPLEGLFSAGTHTVVWGGEGTGSARVPAGIYVYRLSAETGTSAGRVVLKR